MSNHARRRPNGPGWLERGVKLRGRTVRTRAKGERSSADPQRRVRRLVAGRSKEHARRRT